MIEGFWVWVICYKLEVTVKVNTFFFLSSRHINSTMNEMDQFLENHKLPKLTQDKRATIIKEIEFIVKNLQKQNVQAQMVHWRILPNVLRRISTNSSQSLPEK